MTGKMNLNGLNPSKISRIKKMVPIAIRIMDDFFSNFELTPITKPMIIKIISHPNIQLGNNHPAPRFFNNRNNPKITMAAPITADLLFLGGILGSC